MQAYGVISRILLRCLAGRRKAGRKALHFALDLIAEELKKGPRGGRKNSEAALKALAISDVKDEKAVLPLLVEAVNSEYGKVRGEAYRRIKELSFAAKQHIVPLAAISAVIHEDREFLGGRTLKALYELIKKYDSTFFLSGFPVIYSIEGFSLAVLCKYLLRAAVDIMLFPESAVKGFLDIKKDNQEAINLIYTVLYKGRDLIFSLSRDAYSILYELILQRVELTEKGSAEYFWQLLADMEKEQVKLPADADALKGFIAEPNFPCYFTGILPFRQLSFLKK